MMQRFQNSHTVSFLVSRRLFFSSCSLLTSSMYWSLVIFPLTLLQPILLNIWIYFLFLFPSSSALFHPSFSSFLELNSKTVVVARMKFKGLSIWLLLLLFTSFSTYTFVCYCTMRTHLCYVRIQIQRSWSWMLPHSFTIFGASPFTSFESYQESHLPHPRGLS